MDSLGSWGGCAGTAELCGQAPVGDSAVAPKGSSLSCPGPAVLTTFPVWEMQPPECLRLNEFAHANSGVIYFQFDHSGLVSNYRGLVFLAFLLLGAGGVMAPVVVQGHQ